MATFAIGDVHGCRETFDALLARLPIDWQRDRLWLTGDLVNRGPDNVGVLRRVMGLEARLGDRLQGVLGNHDLHLLARAAGLSEAKRRDTLDDVLAAPDREALVAWLRARPLAHREGDRLLIHAGVPPEWDLDRIEALAREAESALRGPDGWRLTTAALDPPERWSEDLTTRERVLFTLSTLVRLRTMRDDGRACGKYAGPPEAAPPGCRPWFEAPHRLSVGATIVFGHWAALGFRRLPGLWALDSGCVWGQKLTAVNLETGELWQENTREAGLAAHQD